MMSLTWYPERMVKTSPLNQTIVILLCMDGEIRRLAITGVPTWVQTNQDIESHILKPENLSYLWDKAAPVVNRRPSIAALTSLNYLDYV